MRSDRLVRVLVDLELTIRAGSPHHLFPWLFCVWGGILAARAPTPVRPKISFPHSMARRMLSSPSRHRLAAVVPNLLRLGKNLWHVSGHLPQAMIHGVLEKCFVLGPRSLYRRVTHKSPFSPLYSTPCSDTIGCMSQIQPGRPSSCLLARGLDLCLSLEITGNELSETKAGRGVIEK